MAGDHLTSAHPPAAGHAAVSAYLDELAARLPGPGPSRRAILAELHDGLLEAAAEHRAAGLPATAAAVAAVASFGDPAAVAASFTPELAAARARRTAVALACTGPLVGFLWLVAMTVSHASQGLRVPLLAPDPAGVFVAFPLLGVAIATAMLAAGLAVAVTGRVSRWLGYYPHVAVSAAATAGIAVVSADVTLLGMITAQAVVAPAALAWPLVALAAAGSLARVTLAGGAARRCLATRAALDAGA